MRQLFYRLIALVFFILSMPILTVLFFLIKFSSPGPFIFKQKRAGKNGKAFYMYKIRTMVQNAEKMKKKYLKKNEADGPVFKIREDPRYTRIGKFLSYIGIDELPQLINVLKGEMSLVGSRPLPVEEALKIPEKYKKRFDVLPGMTSLWIIKGAHKLSFNEWMKLDLKYVKNNNIFLDFRILVKTLFLVSVQLVKEFSSL